jgi:hypothetical protein
LAVLLFTSKLKRAPQSPIAAWCSFAFVFLLVRYHFDVVLIFRHSAPRGKLFHCGVAKDALGFSSPSCAYYHADQCHTYHNPGSTPTRAAMVIQYTAQ